jgi:hypothetical protein
MNTLDLVRYAAFRQKIPSEFLTTQIEATPISQSQILASYSVDVLLAALCSALLQATAMTACRLMMGTPHLKTLSFQVSTKPMVLMSFPFILGCYFFFSYFFNQGQSAGLSRMKLRVNLNQHDFVGSLTHAIQSLKIVFSLGFYLRAVSASYLAEDHLYQEFMSKGTEEIVVLEIEPAAYEDYSQAA